MVTLFGPLPTRNAGTAASPATASPVFARARMTRLVREPDAANPHVRFDEREVETASWGDTRAPATERAGNTQGFPRRPRHLSTLLDPRCCPQWRGSRLVYRELQLAGVTPMAPGQDSS